MKALLVFLIIAAVSANEFTVTDGPTAEDFIKGFLKGIGDKKSPDDMIKCLHKVEEIVTKIHEALELIFTFNIQNIIKGVTQLLPAIRELDDAIKPCAQGYETLEKLFNAIINADFNKIIFQKSIIFMGYIGNAISCFKDGKYECVGKNLGTVLKEIFLNSGLVEAPDGLAFLKGFVEGLGSHFDVNQFKNCVKDFKTLFDAIKQAFEALKSGKLDKIIIGVTVLIDAAKTLINDLKTCAKDAEIVKKLIKALSDINILKIARKLLLHITEVISITVKTVPCFANSDYHCIGFGFGAMLKLALF